MDYYLHQNGNTQGPYSSDFLRDLVHQGAVADDALVWADGFAEWRPWNQVRQEVLPPTRPAEGTKPSAETDIFFSPDRWRSFSDQTVGKMLFRSSDQQRIRPARVNIERVGGILSLILFLPGLVASLGLLVWGFCHWPSRLAAFILCLPAAFFGALSWWVWILLKQLGRILECGDQAVRVVDHRDRKVIIPYSQLTAFALDMGAFQFFDGGSSISSKSSFKFRFVSGDPRVEIVHHCTVGYQEAAEAEQVCRAVSAAMRPRLERMLDAGESLHWGNLELRRERVICHVNGKAWSLPYTENFSY